MYILKRSLCMILIFSAAIITADTVAESGRAVTEKWKDAVVTIKLVIELHDYENKLEVLGTLIDPSGLIVLSLSSVDPSGTHFGSGSEAKVKDVKITTADGEEFPAKVVLRDRDLDLAFIRITEKPKKGLPAINLEDDQKAEMLDQIVMISQLGSQSGYAPYVTLCRVQAVVQKPRIYYVPDFFGLFSGLGTPAFSLDGKVVGLLLLRATQSTGSSMGEPYGGLGSLGMYPIILPAEQILKVVKHVPPAEE